MDKITFLCLSQFIESFNSNNTSELFDNVQAVSSWFSKSVMTVGKLKSFNIVQEELLNLAQFIVQGKSVTLRACFKLVNALKEMQSEMLEGFDIVAFVTKSVELKFNDRIKVIVIKNETECIDLAYNFQNELKYLICLKNENISDELYNAVDISLNSEELLEAVNLCYPIDMFTYDRLYLTAKLNKIRREKSRILLTGSSYTMVGLLEDKMPYPASNVAVNNQDLYFSLLSVKEAIKRSEALDTIVISFAYYFFFSDMTINPSDYMLSILSKVNYPVYNTLHGYKGKVVPLYTKSTTCPVYEAIINLENVRDRYHNAIVKDLENRQYYNEINIRPSGGMLSYNFLEKSNEQNYAGAKLIVEAHNSTFDLDKGINNRNLLDKFLDNMEELNKKVILFVPPVTKFYKDSVSKQMMGIYNKLVTEVADKHKCCTFIDLFNSDKFDETDFKDYDHLNMKGANKLSDIISEYIKEK